MENKGEYYSLKWSDFRSSFSEGFHDFLQEEAMVDVTLAAEGKFVQAHKLVLSVCSPYFKNLFQVNPCKHPIVILKDVDLRDLSYMLEFMYKGEVGVKKKDLSSFIKLAETLSVKGISEEILKESGNFPAQNLDSNLARVRKKPSKDPVPEVRKENTEYHSNNDKSNNKILKNGKKRLSSKSVSIKKLKSDKCDNSSVSASQEKKSVVVSDEEDNNPLVKFMKDQVFQIEEKINPKKSEPQCWNKNDESDPSYKQSYTVWNDRPESDESDVSQSDHSEQIDETQDVFLIHSALRVSPVWNYYDKVQNNMAVCKICRKILKGAQTTQAEYHLRAKHPFEASTFLKQKAQWLEKKKKMYSVFIPGVGVV